MKTLIVLLSVLSLSPSAKAQSTPFLTCRNAQEALIIHYSTSAPSQPSQPPVMSMYYATYFRNGNPVWAANLSRQARVGIPEQQLPYYDTFVGAVNSRRIFLGVSGRATRMGYLSDLKVNGQTSRMVCLYAQPM